MRPRRGTAPSCGFSIILLAALALGCGDETSGSSPGPSGGGGQGGQGGQGGGGSPLGGGAVLPCPPGELELADGSCLAPGVPDDGCGEGFVASGDGGCEATLPTTPCTAGQLALPGETDCRAVAPCGAGTWGDIPVDGSTHYVDWSYPGGDSDGSAAKPWLSVQQAVAVAADGALVAIAPGNYAEAVVLDHPLRLWGKCPAEVALTGAGGAALRVSAGGAGSEIHNLAVSGNGEGVRVDDATDVVLERVWIHDTSLGGLVVAFQTLAASATLRDSLIEGSGDVGVRASGTDVTVQDSVIRDIDPDAAGNWGVGLDARGLIGGAATSVTAQHVLIERARAHAVVAIGTVELLLEDTLIRDTQAELSTGEQGHGVWVYWADDGGGIARPTTTLRGVVVERSRWIGVHSNGHDLNVERTVVRDTDPEEVGAAGGLGLSAYAIEPLPGNPPLVRVSQSLIENSYVNGVELSGVDAELESTIIRHVEPRPDLTNGIGLTAYPSPNSGDRTQLSMRGCRVQDTRQGGIFVGGSSAHFDSTAVLDTKPRELDGGLGVGLSLLVTLDTQELSDGTLNRTVVDGAYSGGIAVAGAAVTMTDVLVRNVQPQLSIDDFGDGIGISSTMVVLPGLFPTSAVLTRTTVEGAPRAGVSVFSADVSIADSLMACNTIDLDGEEIDGAPYAFADLGGNVCGCGEEQWPCKVLSNDLQPPLGL